ncbi:LamB/YcsF family protein [Arthrobacter sp. Sa2CUA1]|uniref:5-oxoprolinase subunit A n=1 Tax=Arthrobacter gallicola TaxID=2762225 RepID=A0ABR8UPL2_9MICC|nr:5-oxoprolinase subunit PxpA [Arthrobacter gallicola]MBD7994505.1 LamB/YcsF family protein [Arthrobacter gallicola]
MTTIDLNADVGESFGRWSLGDDAAMISAVSSVNVACGFHAGDAGTMYAACLSAARAGTAVGAHPGYRDLSGFGRRALDMEPELLTGEVIYQIGALQSLALAAGTRVSYVKPHGALYNTIAHDPRQAQAVINAVLAVSPDLPLVVLPGSVVEKLAGGAGLRTVAEAFADRAYNADGTLLSRTRPDAVLEDLGEITDHVLRLAVDGKIQAVDGTVIDVVAESICVHGDTPGAVAMGQAVRTALEEHGVTVASFI